MRQASSGRRDPLSGPAGVGLAFAPWVAYGILSGAGAWTAALLMAFGLAAALNVYRALRRRPKVFEVVSFAYFGVALPAWLLLEPRLWMAWGLCLGYGALAAMAWGSLATRTPFTAQYRPDDRPPGDESPIFHATHALISALWGGLFVLVGLVHLPGVALPRGVRLLAAAGLIAAGAGLSIVVGRVYPRWLLSRRFLRPPLRFGGRWTSPHLAHTSTGAKASHDVIVVGAGIGGLACGALLARRGLQILVLEQHAVVGGFCHSFVRGRRRFRFDAAVHDISGLGPRGPVRHLLRTLGIENQLQLLRMDHEYILPGLRLRVPRDPSAFASALRLRFPQEAGNISAFFREVEAVYRDVYADVERTGGVPRRPQDIEALLRYPVLHPHHARWLGKNYRQMLDAYFVDERLKRFFSVLTGYLGGPASNLPASLMTTILGSYYLDGGFYPQGGSQSFADALARVITGAGGTVVTNTRVTRILQEDGKVAGVTTARGETFRAPVVVSNVDVKQTFLHLLGGMHLDVDFRRYVSGLRMSTTAASVFLGIDFHPDLAPLAFYVPEEADEVDAAASPRLAMAIPSLVDPSLAPPGQHTLTLIALVPSSQARHLFEQPGYRKTAAYRSEKRAMADRLIQQAERVLPGLSRHIVLRDAATALTFERYSLSTDGAIYGIEQPSDQMEDQRPYFKTPIAGLYLVGAATFPGAGVEAVVISAVIAADDICPESTRLAASALVGA